MTNRKLNTILLLFAVSFWVNGCTMFLTEMKIKELYENPNIDSYDVKKVALLPMENDADSLKGTYYSTNHFFNILENDFPDLDMSDIDKIRQYDCSFIKEQLALLRSQKRINLEKFYSTELGEVLKETNYDAILVGEINDTSHAYTVAFYPEEKRVGLAKSTRCEIVYYLVSLIDGKILWKIRSRGENITYEDSREYPPIDTAISYAIDNMIEHLPKRIFSASFTTD